LESNANTTLSALPELGSLNKQEALTFTLAASLIGVVDNVPVWSLIEVRPTTGYVNVLAPVTVKVKSPSITAFPTSPVIRANPLPVNPCATEVVIVTTPAVTLAAVMLFATSIKKNGNCNGLPPLVNDPVRAITPRRGFQYPSILPFKLSLTSPTSNWFN
jgi:hypothetical protein